METIPAYSNLATGVCGLRFFVPRLCELAKQSADADSMVTARVVDTYSNILTVKLFARIVDEDAYVREVMDEHQVASALHMRMETRFELTLRMLNALLLASTAVIGVSLWKQGLISTSQLVVALPLVWQITNMASSIASSSASMFEGIGTVQSGIETIAVPHALIDDTAAKPIKVTRGEIRFEQVTFAYDVGKQVLNNIDLTVHPGERIGLIGRSGAGKSTLVNLLLRFFDIDRGRITIDGQDIRHITQESLRTQIGLVTQDTSLLHR